jgi:hypothetical protein
MINSRQRDEQETRNTLQRVLDERRDAYIASLRAADRGRHQEWVQFFAQAVLDALKG